MKGFIEFIKRNDKIDDDTKIEILEYIEKIDTAGVSQEEYNKVVEERDNIKKKYIERFENGSFSKEKEEKEEEKEEIDVKEI